MRHHRRLPWLALLAVASCAESSTPAPSIETLKAQAAAYAEENPPPTAEAGELPEISWTVNPEPPEVPPPPEPPGPIDFVVPEGPDGPVGTIEGSLSVSRTGGAGYLVRLEVPPGFRGVEPDLALSYADDRRLGLAGAGVDLVGLPRIHRCGGLNGYSVILPRARDTTDQDELCLDGVRLVLVGGTHGMNGATYKLEIDDGTTIRATGACDAFMAGPNHPRLGPARTLSGPCQFEATRKNGDRLLFGGSAAIACGGIDSLVEPVSPAPRIEWPLYELSDSSGNVMQVDWTSGLEAADESAWGDARTCLPEAVHYGINTQLGRNSDRRVRFEYVVPPMGGRHVSFAGGIRQSRSRYLSQITTETGPAAAPTTVKTYELTYEESTTTALPVLTRLTECGSDGACLPPTILERTSRGWLERSVFWSAGATPPTPNRGVPDPSWGVVVSGDFNGDGRPDFVTKWDTSPVGDFGLWQTSPLSPHSLDWAIQTLPSPLSQSEQIALNGGGLDFAHGVLAGDLDGDGFDDVVVGGNASYHVYTGSATGLSLTPTYSHSGLGVQLGPRMIMADFDGDGRADILAFSDTFGWVRYAFSTASSSFVALSQGSLPTVDSVPDFDEREYHDSMRVSIRTGDFDGDGRTDILAYRRVFMGQTVPDPSDYQKSSESDRDKYWEDPSTYAYGTAFQVLVSRGATFEPFDKGLWPTKTVVALPGDFNADRLTDLLLVARSGALVSVSTGTHLTPDVSPTSEYPFGGCNPRPASGTLRGCPWTATAPGIHLGWRVYVADFDGDGRSDVFTARQLTPEAITGGEAGWKIFRAPAPPLPQRLTHLELARDRFDPALHQTPETPFRLGLDSVSSGAVLIGDFEGRGVASVLYDRAYTSGNSVSGGSRMLLGAPSDDLSRITNGLGERIELERRPLVQTGYERGATLTAPLHRFTPSREVVDVVRTIEPQTGQTYVTEYDFDEGALDPRGRGFLGFERVRRRTAPTIEVTRYRLEHPLTGLVASRETQLLESNPYDWSGPPLRRTTYEQSAYPVAPGVHMPWIEREQTTDFHVDSPLGSSRVGTRSSVEREYDVHGNIVLEETDPNLDLPGDEVQVVQTYRNDASRHVFGLLTGRATYFGGARPIEETFEYDALDNQTFHGTKDHDTGRYLGVRRSHDALGNLDFSTAPNGAVTAFAYGPNGMDATITDPNGNVIEKDFHTGFGVERARRDANGVQGTMVLDGFGRIERITGPNASGSGWVTMKRFERLPVSVETPDRGLVQAGYLSRTYSLERWEPGASVDDEMRLEEQLHDAMDRVRVKRRRHRVSGVTNGLVDFVVQSDVHYDERVANLPRWESRPFYRPNGDPVFSHYVYDARQRPVRTYRPDGEVVQLVYDDVSRQVARHEPGNTTLLALDAHGELLAKRDGNGAVTRYVYDNLSRLTRTIDPIGVVTATSYDGLGRKVYVTHSDTGTTQLMYDADGHLEAEIDPKGQMVRRTFDATDRTRARRFYDAAGTLERAIVYGYDEASSVLGRGRLTGVDVLDGAGAVLQTHDFDYDDYGRQSAVRMSLGGMSLAYAYEYAPSGEAIGLTYPDGSRLRMNYLRGGLLASVDLEDSQTSTTGFRPLVHYRAFDPEGRPEVEERANQTVVCQRYAAESGYLERHAVIRYALGIPDEPCAHLDGAELEYAHDDLLDNDYRWSRSGRIAEIKDLLPMGRNQSFDYDAVGQLLRASAPGLYGTRDFGYDAAGNRDTVDGMVQSFSGHRLMGRSDGLQVYWDANGNMTEQRIANVPQKIMTWTVDDRLASLVTGSGLQRYDYDFSGHRVFKHDEATGTQTWYFGREFEVTELPGGQRLATKYVPGPTGMVAQVTHPWTAQTQAAAASTFQVVLGARPLRLTPEGLSAAFAAVALALPTFDKAAVVEGWCIGLLATLVLGLLALVARTNGDGARSRRVGRGAAAYVTVCAFLATFGLGTPEALAINAGPNGPGVPRAAGVRFLYGDHVGSTSLVVDDAPQAAVVARYHYSPFGTVSGASTGTDEVRPKLHGHELDASGGLYYGGQRYMDPALGTFVSADISLGAPALEATALHRYAYSANNPISYRDPSGRFAVTSVLVSIALFAVAGALVAGTEGKILTDPGNAFSSWSWSRAAQGAMLGMAAAGVGAALGALGASVSIAGMSMKGVLQTMWSTAVVRATMEYAHGGDGVAIAKAFGIGAVSGLISATGVFGMSELSAAGKWMSQQLAALADSALKLAADQEASLKLSLWVFSATVDHKGKLKFGPDWSFIGKKAFGLVGDLTKSKGWDEPLGNLAKGVGLNVKLSSGGADGRASFYGLSGIVRQGATGDLSFFDLAARLGRSVVAYGAAEAKKTKAVNAVPVLGGLVVDGAKAGLDYGIGKGRCALEPDASGC